MNIQLIMACSSSFVTLSVLSHTSCCQVLLFVQVHSINVAQPFVEAALPEFFPGNLTTSTGAEYNLNKLKHKLAVLVAPMADSERAPQDTSKHDVHDFKHLAKSGFVSMGQTICYSSTTKHNQRKANIAVLGIGSRVMMAAQEHAAGSQTAHTPRVQL